MTLVIIEVIQFVSVFCAPIIPGYKVCERARDLISNDFLALAQAPAGYKSLSAFYFTPRLGACPCLEESLRINLTDIDPMQHLTLSSINFT